MELPFKCPLCGNKLSVKKVEKLIKGGNNAALLMVNAGVCFKCGEHLYNPEDVEKFEEVEKKLKENATEEFKLIGNTYKVA